LRPASAIIETRLATTTNTKAAAAIVVDGLRTLLSSSHVDAMRKTPYATVVEELRREGPKGNKARQRGQLALAKFIAMARRVWPPQTNEAK
jgi:hypothetical protein